MAMTRQLWTLNGLATELGLIDRVESPVDKAQLLVFMYLIYQIGPLAAYMAVMAGAPMKGAYAIHNFMIALLAMEATDICAAWVWLRTNCPGRCRAGTDLLPLMLRKLPTSSRKRSHFWRHEGGRRQDGKGIDPGLPRARAHSGNRVSRVRSISPARS